MIWIFTSSIVKRKRQISIHNLFVCSKFQEANFPFLTLKWTGQDSKDYFSVLVNSCGYIVLELISDPLTIELDMIHSKPRMVWSQWNDEYVAEREYLTPIKV